MKSNTDRKMSKTEIFAYLIKKYPSEKFMGIGDMATDAIGVLWGTEKKKN